MVNLFFFAKVCELRLVISSCNEIRTVTYNMVEKFAKYWNAIHEITGVTTILDPKFKMKLIEYYFSKI